MMFRQKEIESKSVFKLTEKQYQMLEEEEAIYLKGEGKSYTCEEALQIAKGELSK